MPTTISPTGIANLALSKIGAQAIGSLTDPTSTSAIACNNNFQLAYLEVSRAHSWNCILNLAILTQIPQTPVPTIPPPSPVTAWAPLTSYSANVFLSYGGYIYFTAYAYTSSLSFENDLTTGALIQTNQPTSGPASFGYPDGSQYPSGWAFQYALPTDFQLLAVVNDYECWNYTSQGDNYEIIGSSLYTDAQQAIIKYVSNVADTTRFDALMTGAIVLNLAAKIATTLRQDGGKLEGQMLMEYQRVIAQARLKDAGERQPFQFNPIGTSRFVASRWGGING